MSEWRERFADLGFQPTECGGMRGRFEDIEITAVVHPFRGLCLMGNHFDGRSANEFETFISVDSDFQAIAAALVHIHNLVHPKNVATQPPKPARKRPSNEEALAQVPALLHQFQAVLDELSFLFQRHLIQDGYMDRKIGEIIAAYVYDLELIQDYSECSAAKARDGRTVQVLTTRAQKSRETVVLNHVGEHLIVVQLWGREVIEVYNGPLEPIWEYARRVQQDGKRRISMGRLRGQNVYRVLSDQKIRSQRAWNLDTETQ